MHLTQRRTLRLVALFVTVGALVAIGAATGVRSRFTVENLRAATQSAGVLGMLLFAAAFCVGELLYVPGLIFIVAAVLAWGQLMGGALAFVSAVVSVSLTFAVVRGAGGKALGESKNRWVRRILARLDAHPISTVVVLRLVFQVSPPVNYALALSSMRFVDFLVGSAIGLLVPVAVVAIFIERVARLLAR